MSGAPKENLSTALYDRRPVVWWALVIGSILGGVACIVHACSVGMS